MAQEKRNPLPVGDYYEWLIEDEKAGSMKVNLMSTWLKWKAGNPTTVHTNSTSTKEDGYTFVQYTVKATPTKRSMLLPPSTCAAGTTYDQVDLIPIVDTDLLSSLSTAKRVLLGVAGVAVLGGIAFLIATRNQKPAK